MPFTFRTREIHTVAVIGSGQIGPDIALFFAQALEPYGARVMVHDIAQEALDKGRERIEAKLDKAAQKRGKPEKAEKTKALFTWTTDAQALAEADWIVEAASETLGIKQQIFAELDKLAKPGALLTSNSSHLEPERIFEPVADKSRCANVHFFFPADRNLVVEVISAEATSPSAELWVREALELLGKLPVRVDGRYGYALNPLYEGVLMEAILCVEDGLASPKQVDAVAQKVLGFGAGPFTVANLCGANPIAVEGLENLHERIQPWFRVPNSLREKAAASEAWEAAAKDETVEVDETTTQQVGERLLGAYFTIAAEILDAGIVDMGEFEQAVQLAFDCTPPLALINQVGVERAEFVARQFLERAGMDATAVPAGIRVHAKYQEGFETPVVFTELRDDVALVQIRRPKVLNALNEEVFAQLDEVFTALRDNSAVKAVVLTGFGTRAFVAGADIPELAALLEEGDPKQAAVEKCRRMQKPLLLIENLGKPVVAALNGLALGGGSELAMACTARIGVTGMVVGQPEPNLGLIPGAGGTQRLPRLVGFEAAWPILRTAKPIDANRAKEIGYLEEVVAPTEVRDRALDLARKLAAGEAEPVRRVRKEALEPTPAPEAELGHLSTRIDQLLQEAVLEGNAKPLAEGLEVEYDRFGECFLTTDGRIGLRNFLENGPKAAATFEHK